MGGPARVIFVSYAHEDSDVLDRLRVVLKPLERGGQVEVWADRQIEAGGQWNDAIESSLARAHIAILLVSADFWRPTSS